MHIDHDHTMWRAKFEFFSKFGRVAAQILRKSKKFDGDRLIFPLKVDIGQWQPRCILRLCGGNLTQMKLWRSFNEEDLPHFQVPWVADDFMCHVSIKLHSEPIAKLPTFYLN